jgi:hypothetical protein
MDPLLTPMLVFSNVWGFGCLQATIKQTDITKKNTTTLKPTREEQLL